MKNLWKLSELCLDKIFKRINRILGAVFDRIFELKIHDEISLNDFLEKSLKEFLEKYYGGITEHFDFWRKPWRIPRGISVGILGIISE